jgi:sortase A
MCLPVSREVKSRCYGWFYGWGRIERNREMKRKSGNTLMRIGVLLLAAALALTGYNIWDDNRADRAAASVVDQLPQELVSEEEEAPLYKSHPNMEMPTVEIDGRRYIGRLSIPSINLDLPVLSEWSTTNGRIAPCRYEGSAYANDLIIAGHNYRSHFGSLKSVGVGEPIYFIDADGNLFSYVVAAMEILDGTAVEEMKAVEWDLSLFTCTYGGQTRLTLRCVEQG